ncbi:MAG: hypothetical protein NT157_05595, partial [Candidatus Micrarchaeota archaeon]|nr:hypothetical protein [Candidatus Micrarchaeota archaeon]
AMDLAAAEEKKFDETKWGLLNSILAGAYPLSGRSVEENGRELLGWLIRSVPKIEKENGGPVYLELVSSSFMNRLRWFAVQVADFPLMHSIPAPPKDAQFVSNSDFCGHGEVKGRKEIFVFSRKAFGALGSKKSADTMLELARINAEKRDFVVVLPQEALTGTNLSDLKQASGKYFSNACAVLEYQMLGGSEWAGSLHQELSCEHFEQLARDFKLLFIPVEKLSLGGFEAKLGDEHAMPMAGDVHLACDRERRVAWGSLRNLE